MLWKKILRTNITNVDHLCTFLELNDEDKKRVLKAPSFILNLPLRLAQKIKKGTLNDPILRQFVPLTDELNPSGIKDPVCDTEFTVTQKLLKKYPSRALIVSTSACAMHCRYCFRQNYPYETNVKGFERELKEIKENSSLSEIILSGGDPLSLPDEQWERFFDEISLASHIKRVRFHTRFPIGIPERIDDSFMALLKRLKKQIWFVIHSNHPLELDEEVLASLKQLQQMGIAILNQSVLLRGVNDDEETLKLLSERLVDNGIMPYYLHQLDPVRGASHFEVPKERGLELVSHLQNNLSGYAVPKYVEEVPRQASKTPILTSFQQ